ncbi:MAG: YdcF family protein [Alphaproteobacteria bacterium]|nr:YdcF family protein [Alphaproteobacteria bacterium]
MLQSGDQRLPWSLVFALSKIFWLVANPTMVIQVLVVLGTLLLWTRRWCVLGRALVSVGAVVLLLVGLLPVGALMVARLEDRFPPPALPATVDGIVLLGGFISVGVGHERGTVELNTMADRLTGFVALARRYPDARLVFSGGSAALTGDQPPEAEGARRLLEDLGVPLERVTFEDRSRNTAENATETKALVDPQPGETWLLVTSAFHMPRAVASFRKAGWAVVPVPMDYQTGGAGSIGLTLDPQGNLGAFNLAMHEVIGLVAYRFMGHIDTLWPAP